MTKTQRQAAILAVLVAALGGAYWMQGGDPDPAAGPAPAANPAQQTRAAGSGDAAVADVRLELLKAERGELADADRNPFRFQARETPAPPRPVTPAKPVVVAPPVPAGPPPLPPIPLKFIGVLDAPPPLGKVAMLSDGRGNTFQPREGDIIEGRYRLLRIGTESAELAYADGRGRQTIRLSGQ